MRRASWAAPVVALGIAAFFPSFHARAQELVQFPTAGEGGADGGQKAEAAVLRPPAQDPTKKLPAVVLLHSAWGWNDDHEGFHTYGEALSKAGFLALELRMFPRSNSSRGLPGAYLPELFGALKYLASRPDVDSKRIAVAGFSFGGILTLISATSWANDKFSSTGLRPAAYAPFYPVCWVMKESVKGRPSAVPTSAWSSWTGAPVRIYAGAMDDYDDKDPNACTDFVEALPESQRKAFSVRVFENATHGWDQRLPANFNEKLACKGRGCNNSNVPNPEATQQSIKDLIDFLSGAMPG